MIATAMPPHTARILATLAIIIFLTPVSASMALDLETVQEAIRLSGASWVAEDNEISRLSYEDKKKLMGLLPEPASNEFSSRAFNSFTVIAPPPPRLDWRDIANRSYVTPARHQGDCGSCWAFAAVGALESYVMLRAPIDEPVIDIDLSEQALISCDENENGGCSGDTGRTAADLLKNGVPTEECQPYKLGNNASLDVPCNDDCDAPNTIPSDRRILPWPDLNNQPTSRQIIDTLKSNLATHGPLWTSMQVYDDFDNYSSGIYSYTTGSRIGGHAVLLIGYNDNDASFIVKNSWGANWGENGTFRIAYSQVANEVGFGGSTYTYGEPVDIELEAPTADAGRDQEAHEGAVVSLNGSASSDPDGRIESYQWEQVGGPEVDLTDVDTNRANIRFTTPNLTTAGDTDIIFELTVWDNNGLQATDTVAITVEWENDAPTADAGGNRRRGEGINIKIDGGNSNDPEGERLSYHWEQQGEPKVSLDGADTSQLSLTTPNLTTSTDAELFFQLTVTDPHNASATDRVKITVTWENDAPVAQAGQDQQVDGNSTVILDGNASSDTENDIRTYQWRQVDGPSIDLTDAQTARASFTSPDLTTADDRELRFELTVIDGAGSEAADEVAVTIIARNEPPTASAGEDQTVEGGNSVTLDASASSDPNNDIATYAWTQVAGPEVQLSTPDEAQTSFTAPANDGTDSLQLRFELQVTDAGGRSATDNVEIWITPQSGPTDPTDPQDPGDNPSPGDEPDSPKDTPEPEVTSSGGGSGGCFITHVLQPDADL